MGPPSIRCHDASRIASVLFEQDHITQIKIQDDRLGLLVMTRSRREFSRALTRISLNGHTTARSGLGRAGFAQRSGALTARTVLQGSLFPKPRSHYVVDVRMTTCFTSRPRQQV